MTAGKVFVCCIQAVVFILLSPLISGFIRKVKNNLRMREGAPLLQPYYNFIKLFSKGEVVSKQTSWIFTVTPAVVLGSSICAVFLLPVFMKEYALPPFADLLAVFFTLAVGRFFLALAGLDAGSSFGGMGSSREMFISSMVEPVVFVSLFVLAMNSQSTSVSAAAAGAGGVKASVLLAGCAFFLAMIAETSRVPVDNQETHLELTMTHEAMVLEYSGRPLALVELAAHIKQAVFFTVLAYFLVPLGGRMWFWFVMPLGLLIISIIVACLEVSVAKMRLFRVVDYLSFAFFIAFLSAVCACAGV